MRTLVTVIGLLAAAGFAEAQTYSLKTFAGGGVPDNVAATSASLGSVSGVAVDKLGAVYISLYDYNTVLRMATSAGILTRVAQDALASPMGLAVDANGKVYIAESGAFRVRVAADGALSDVAGYGSQGYGGDNGSAPSARFDTPTAVALAVDSSGAVYIADFYNHVVRKVQDGVVTTVAGTGEYGLGADNVPATSTPLAGPSGIALDASGNLYIAEAYNNRIRKVANGIVTTVAATGSTLRQPSDVAVDATGNLYIADFGNNRIRMVSTANVMTTVAGNGTLNSTGDGGAATSAGLAAPRRIALDATGALYIADGVRVRRVVRGAISTIAGGGAPAGENGPAAAAQLATPLGVAVDASGSVYVSDAGTARVVKITGDTLTRIAGTGNPAASVTETGPSTTTALGAPSGLAVDASGAVYVADMTAARVRKISGGTTTTFAGGGTTFGDGGPALKAQLTAPDGLAIGANGTVYVSDGNRVRAIADGTIQPFAGNGSVGYQGDGALATAARVSSPAGLAVDTAGTVYLADMGNGRIRTVSGGIISTVTGASALTSPVAVAVDGAGDLYVSEPTRVLKLSKGKITTLAGFNNPQGLAVDASGNVYVADPANHRVAVLNPAGTSCAVTVAMTTPAPILPADGAAPTLRIVTGASCPWAIDGLPSWITLSRLPYGSGNASVPLTVAPNSDVPRSATLTIGGQTVAISQAGVATLSGVISDAATGKAMPGVTVTIAVLGSTATVTTDAGGNYVVPNLVSTGPYVITPSLAGYGFVPASTTLATLSATPTANFAAWIRPKIAALTPSAYAPGQIVTLYGENLCGPAAAANPTLPDRLASCIVKVDSTNLRLYYASSNQINAVLPQTLTVGAHQLTVQRYTTTAYSTLAAASEPLSFTVAPIALSLWQVAQTGDIAVIYATGLGKKSQTFAEGAAPGKAANAVEQIRATVEGQPATVLYSGVQPQYPGLDQINIRIPAAARPAVLEITAVSTGQTVRYTLPPL